MMPLGGLMLAIFVGWRVAPAAIKEELAIKSPWFFNTWFWLLRWVVPVSIAAIFLSNL
jgi:NSS family neurotransmitter:Na+ symporter